MWRLNNYHFEFAVGLIIVIYKGPTAYLSSKIPYRLIASKGLAIHICDGTLMGW